MTLQTKINVKHKAITVKAKATTGTTGATTTIATTVTVAFAGLGRR